MAYQTLQQATAVCVEYVKPFEQLNIVFFCSLIISTMHEA